MVKQKEIIFFSLPLMQFQACLYKKSSVVLQF